ncbi:hypothetical protein BA895_21630 [Humibacillus sp. DSM 29435]|uniref:hypothetical protein n=1 Tax=Humibacillus sp. DSM 29435 TaxID=1869167 RepID=UPI0008727A93|nr:hypothetical protein [Humibacillus sp. DSM 29435]OFE15720.1 hypothetical protein BA895_21630 [Humibacillus sp. DSM 29435]
MTTWLIEGFASVLLFAFLSLVLAGPLLAVVYRRFRYAAPLPTLLVAATALYGGALVAFTTFPCRPTSTGTAVRAPSSTTGS